MLLNPAQKKLIKFWMRENKILYNQAISELNKHQGFSHLGTAKGTSPQQFQTRWGQVYGWRKNVPVKIQHRTLWRAYQAWTQAQRQQKTLLACIFFSLQKKSLLDKKINKNYDPNPIICLTMTSTRQFLLFSLKTGENYQFGLNKIKPIPSNFDKSSK
jgi:hypothetical protein